MQAAADRLDDSATALALDEASGRGWPPLRRWLPEIIPLAVFLVAALWVTHHAWRNVNGLALGQKASDQTFNEWMLAYAAHAITHLQNPFFTTLQNAPHGVNLVANVGLILPGVVLSPVTLLGGAALSYKLLITLNLAGTAFAWFWVLSRHFVTHRAAAILGGACLGFAPAMIAHSSGHPHITAQWLIPFIIWRTVRLSEPGRAVRNGLMLAGLIIAQLLISEELLFITAMAGVIAVLVYVALRPRRAGQQARKFIGGLAVAGGVTLVVFAYPLWMQFLGPQTRIGLPNASSYSLRAGSFVTYAQGSIGGNAAAVLHLAPSASEQSSFYGWPLLILTAVAIAWLWRDIRVWMFAIPGAVLGVLSIGTQLSWGAQGLPHRAPFALLQGLSIIDTLIPARLALVTTVAIGMIISLAADRLLSVHVDDRRLTYAVRGLGAAVILGVLVPLAPAPMAVTKQSAVPQFISSGDWRRYVGEGGTLVPVPVANITSIRWGSVGLANFAVPQGYFLGPTSATDKTARWDVDPQSTAKLLTAVAAGTRGTVVTATDVAQAVRDARYWKAEVFVLPADDLNAGRLETVLNQLYGAGTRVDDVWVWRFPGATS